MTKVKTFIEDYPTDLEIEINRFIADNDIVLKDIKYSHTNVKTEVGYENWFSALLIYEVSYGF